jgi:hypothetical protein
MSGALDIGVVVAISVLSAVFITALVALVVVLKKRYCKPVDLITQQYRDIEYVLHILLNVLSQILGACQAYCNDIPISTCSLLHFVHIMPHDTLHGY